ncbi:SPOR domain-containing protein, partial [Bacteroidales bacterium OttesenSCG-928-K22]|nr:SPOR domain-containing protein [Bacteroidales bacterium OttesenSCG-928-K22]
LLLLILNFVIPLSGQSSIGSKEKVNVIAEPEFFSILNKKLTYDVYHSGYMGYRVQIYSNSGNHSKQGAYDAAEAFYKLFPDIPAYVTFKAPNYRVKVGNFRSRLDAEHLLNNIHKDFKASFFVKEFISIFDEPYSPILQEQDSISIYHKDLYDSENVYDESFR